VDAIQLLGFLPDADAATPGALSDCDQMVPTQRGMRSAPSNQPSKYSALAEAVDGSAVCVRADGSSRFFTGTNSTINEGLAGVWSDVSRPGGYASAGSRWRFAQFGNDTIAANKTCVLQKSSGGAFADLVAPKMGLVETVSGFVIGADCDDTGSGLGTAFGDQPNRWWCSGINDAANWVPSLSAQCASGLLVDAPGAIRGIRRLGPNCIIYKDTSIFVGSYVGAQAGVWAWNPIPGDIGCASNEAVVSIGTAHLFPGNDDFYIFDGSRPRPIGAGVRQWFFGRLNRKHQSRISGMHDRINGAVWWFYPSSSSTVGALDSAIVYNYRTQQWGVADRPVEAPVEIVQDGISYNQLGDLFATYDDLPALTYNSPFWVAATPVPAVFGTDHRPYTLSGTPGAWSFTTWAAGDDGAVSLVGRVTPRWIVRPSAATATPSRSMSSGDPLAHGTAVPMGSLGRFDILQAARWHRFVIAGTGDAEISGLSIDAQPAGLE
jgi:hypothetical protein